MSGSSRPWRLIVDPIPAEGAWNMAVDRALLEARAAGEARPTLRVYSWVRPTVSIGRFQDPGGIDVEFCRARGIDIVRRPTGGRGVLHDDEVTYAVAASTEDGIPKGVTASYRWLCRGVEAAFCALGFDARITRRPRGSAAASACYLHAARADLSVGTRKLSGAAQVWMGHAVLQHGSFVLSRDVEREATAFRMDEGERAAFAGTVVTLSARRQGVPTRHEVIEAIRRGFAQALGITFCECALSHVETERAREFARAAADHTRRA